MKAVVQVGYGSADVLETREIDRSVAAEDEVLVRLRAASLAAGDYLRVYPGVSHLGPIMHPIDLLEACATSPGR